MPRRVASTLSSLSVGVFSQLGARAQALQAEGRTVYPLHVGDTWMEPPLVARAESQRTSEHPGLHQYAPVQGMPALLDAIERRLQRLGHPVPRARLQVVNGATSGLSVVTEALLDPGDEVLLPSPFWPLIRGIVAKRGAVAVQVPLWDRLDAIDIEAALEAAVTPRTKAIYVNSPHNPTGRMLTASQMDAMARVAKRHDLWVISDEAYQDLYFGEAPTPFWAHADVRERYVASHTLSKSYGLAGARIGYLHGCEEAMAAIAAVQLYSTYCAPRPMQLGAARALDEGDAFLARRRDEFGEAGRRTAEVLGVPTPEGGTFLFVDASPYLPSDAEDAMPFLERALEAGVQLTPGGSCGEAYERFVRVCFTSLPLDEHDHALEALRRALG
ncbi:MAG: pyridoxal phosphate-dependent aminotransferase [Sandaracinus sp.]|nr:pyridoxal phosphate-dependent aminotransferase [Sandaracinus sp.]MCB9634316.1 pyridoxal phosphate-dependent aminotransferase [Sandaracinus sp.]